MKRFSLGMAVGWLQYEIYRMHHVARAKVFIYYATRAMTSQDNHIVPYIGVHV
jgi:predicted O-linked N-acetylglucosamine transferase (SPINDLY family)